LATGKDGFGGFASAQEANAAEGMADARGNDDAKFAEGGESIGHEAFAAWLVDWRGRAVGHDHAQPATTRGDRGSKAGRATANDENVD
jgi:hypothetical protein